MLTLNEIKKLTTDDFNEVVLVIALKLDDEALSLSSQNSSHRNRGDYLSSLLDGDGDGSLTLSCHVSGVKREILLSRKSLEKMRDFFYLLEIEEDDKRARDEEIISSVDEERINAVYGRVLLNKEPLSKNDESKINQIKNLPFDWFEKDIKILPQLLDHKVLDHSNIDSICHKDRADYLAFLLDGAGSLTLSYNVLGGKREILLSRKSLEKMRDFFCLLDREEKNGIAIKQTRITDVYRRVLLDENLLSQDDESKINQIKNLPYDESKINQIKNLPFDWFEWCEKDIKFLPQLLDHNVRVHSSIDSICHRNRADYLASLLNGAGSLTFLLNGAGSLTLSYNDLGGKREILLSRKSLEKMRDFFCLLDREEKNGIAIKQARITDVYRRVLQHKESLALREEIKIIADKRMTAKGKEGNIGPLMLLGAFFIYIGQKVVESKDKLVNLIVGKKKDNTVDAITPGHQTEERVESSLSINSPSAIDTPSTTLSEGTGGNDLSSQKQPPGTSLAGTSIGLLQEQVLGF